MPFEAKFLNLSTDNYQCFLLNPSNLEIIESVELDETAIRKMKCPFEKLVVIMKNLTNTQEELLFDLPQCELYTIDKDFSQICTIIKNDKQGKRFEGVTAPKDLKYASKSNDDISIKNNENSNQQNVQINSNQDQKTPSKVEQSNLKGYYSPNNSYIGSDNNKPVVNSYANNNSFNYYSKLETNNAGHLNNNLYYQQNGVNYSSKYYNTNPYYQNTPVYKTLDNKSNINNYQRPYTPDKSFNRDSASDQYGDLLKRDNLYTTSVNSQNISKSQIESAADKYKSNVLNINPSNNTYIGVLSNKINNSINVTPEDVNKNKYVSPPIINQTQNFYAKKENEDKKSSDLNAESPIKIENNLNPSLKSTENSSGYTYTLDTFDVNKFLKDLNVTTSSNNQIESQHNHHIDSQQNENLNISNNNNSTNNNNFTSDVNNNDNIQKAEEKSALNYSVNQDLSDKNTNPPIDAPVITNSNRTENESLKSQITEEDNKTDFKVTKETDNVSNLSKSAVVYVGGDSKIDDKHEKNINFNNNDSSFTSLENKNINGKPDLNRSANLVNYDSSFEIYNPSRSNIFSISSNKYCSSKEIKHVLKDIKPETNMIFNNPPLDTTNKTQTAFDSKRVYSDLSNSRIIDLVKPEVDSCNDNTLKEDAEQKTSEVEKKQEEMKHEPVNISSNPEPKDLDTSTLNLVSASNPVSEERKLPTTLIDFNLDEYLKNILKEYEPSFLNIPSPTAIEAESQDVKVVETHVKETEEKPKTNVLSNETPENVININSMTSNDENLNNPESLAANQELIIPVHEIQDEDTDSLILVASAAKNSTSTVNEPPHQQEQLVNLKEFEMKKNKEEEEKEKTKIDIKIKPDEEILINSPSTEKNDEPIDQKIEINNNQSFTFKKQDKTVPLKEKASRVSEFVLAHKAIEFPSIEDILGSTNLNIAGIINPKNDNNTNVSFINVSEIDILKTDNTNNNIIVDKIDNILEDKINNKTDGKIDNIIEDKIDNKTDDKIDNILEDIKDDKVDNKTDDKIDTILEDIKDDKFDNKTDDKIEDTIEDKIDNKVDNKIDDTIADRIEEKIDNKVDYKIEDKIDNKVDNKIDDTIDNRIEDKVDNKIDDTFDYRIEDKIDNRVDNKINDTIDDRIGDKIDNNIKTEINNFINFNNFNDISIIDLQTDINLPTFTLKDISTFEENNTQMDLSYNNKKEDAANQDLKANEELIAQEFSFNTPEENEKQDEINRSLDDKNANASLDISFKEKSSDKAEQIQITLDPNNMDQRNSFIIEEKESKAPSALNALNGNSVPEIIKSPDNISFKEKNANKIDEFNLADHNKKENLIFFPDEINDNYSKIKNFRKTLLGIIMQNNQYNENLDLFYSKNDNSITLKNESTRTLYVRLTGGIEEIQALEDNEHISFMRPQGGIFKLQISLEAKLFRGPVFNVFSGCNYSIDESFKLFDSNGDKVLLSCSKYPENEAESSFNNVFFTFIECENLENLNSLASLANEDFITFINVTSEVISIRIKSDGENSNEDYYPVYPLMAILIQRDRERELLSELKTPSQKIIKYGLTTNNIYILDEDHTLIRASNKEIIENLEQTIKFNFEFDCNEIFYSQIKEQGKTQQQLDDKFNTENNPHLNEEGDEDYFDYEETEFDQENLNEFNIENASSEDLYVRIERKTEGKDAFFLLKSTNDTWTIREDGLFICEIVRTNLSSRRFLINTSYCYEIDKDFNLLESITKRRIRRVYDKLPGNKLNYEGVYAQINYDLDYDFDSDADYFEGLKPKYIKGKKFTDESFPAEECIISAINPLDKKRADTNNPHSLEMISEKVLSSISFKRPEEIFKDQKIFLFNENSNDNNNKNAIETYHQSYISSILATLNQNPALIKEIFKTEAINKDGYYEIFYYENGSKKVMFLDDFFPVFSNKNFQEDSDKVYFSVPSFKNEIWIQLLEKAYAKYEGGYANTTDGDVLSEIYFYTGAISFKYLTENSTRSQSVWENLHAATSGDSNCLVFAGFNDVQANTVKHKSSPLTQFTYSVLACDEFDNGVETMRLIKMKNPAGPIDWLGEFAKDSEKWTDELKTYFGAEEAYEQTGVFFLCFEEFVEQFDFYVVSFTC